MKQYVTVCLGMGAKADGSCLLDSLDLSLGAVELVQKNLGGAGSDSGNKEVRYRGVGNLNDKPLDLVIRVKDNAPY